jgi:hypothetical protein
MKLKNATERSFITNFFLILIFSVVFSFLFLLRDRLTAAMITFSSMKWLLPVATTVANFGTVQFVLKLYVEKLSERIANFRQWAFSN